MDRMRPAGFLLFAVVQGVTCGAALLLAIGGDVGWLFVVAVVGLVPAGALLLVACIGYGVAAGLRQHQADVAAPPRREPTT